MKKTANATESPLESAGTVRPGGRTARTREAVRRATLAELAEKGFSGLTVESVAIRSGVHKTTVYRRWRTPAALAADALGLAEADPWPLPDAGSLSEDLRSLAAQVVEGFTDPLTGPVTRALVAAAAQTPEAALALRSYLTTRHRQAAAVVHRAVERGELPAATDAEELIRATVAPLYYRLCITTEPVSPEDTTRAVTAALAAARAGVFSR
ncbi:TetR/AcrR family transcriptional regulator [Actinocorallia aurantiaca]|uniref:TetR/AcrR family transcriptional regulator n=1 Tax=Actinocorallia aurantiaca TaxID=46204 RepID=A0ABN3U9L0_9ACTN